MAQLQRYLICLLFVLLGTGFLCAQPAVQPDSFRVLSVGETAPLHYDFDTRTTRTVHFPTTNYSKPYPVPIDGRLTFYRLDPNPDPKLPPIRVVVAKIKLRHRSTTTPEPPSPYIVVFMPSHLIVDEPPQLGDDGKVLPFHTMLLDDSLQAHPKDHLRVINFSKRPAAVMFNGKPAILRPRQSINIPYPPGDRTKLHVASYVNHDWRPIVGHTQMLETNTRLTLLLQDKAPNEFDPNPVDLITRKIVEIFPPTR